MRGIKFRAWLKKEKVLVDVATVEYDGNGLDTFESNQRLFEVEISYRHRRENGRKKQAYKYASEVVLEQYTGLKDKNGVEIYENDIVKSNSGSIREVGFNDRRSQFGLYSRKLECWITNELIDDTWEIIGNIHEE